MLIRARIYQLHCDAHGIAGFAHTALEDMADAQLLRDRRGAYIGFAKLKRGRARSQPESLDMGEHVENFLRHAVGKIALVTLRGEVQKRKYGEGRDLDRITRSLPDLRNREPNGK